MRYKSIRVGGDCLQCFPVAPSDIEEEQEKYGSVGCLYRGRVPFTIMDLAVSTYELGEKVRLRNHLSKALGFVSMFGKDIQRMAPSLDTADATPIAFAGSGAPIGMLQQPDQSISKWYFSRKEIENRSPSRLDCIDLKEEKKLRQSYCRFLLDLGMRLNVPQLTIGTAIVFCHRFYLRQSHLKNDRYAIATSCMFLACKVEETPVRLADVTNKGYHIRHGDLDTAWSTNLCNKEKELVLVGERLVLSTLGFDITIDHPYKPLMAAMKKFTIPDSRSLGQVAWSFVNDVQQTTLCLQFKADHIAAGAIFLASKFLEIELSTERGKVWWEGLQVTHRQLEEVSNQILELYEPNNTPKKTQGNGILLTESRSNNRGPSGVIIKYIKRSYF